MIFQGGFSIHDFQNPKRAAEVMKMWNNEFFIRFAVLELIKIYPRGRKDPLTGRIFKKYRSYNAINKLPGNAGEWRGILSTLDIDYIEALPKRWQKILPPISGLGTKERSLIAAREFFPEAVRYLKYKKNADRSDALCMAKYAEILSP